jgi:hypothetical protein
LQVAFLSSDFEQLFAIGFKSDAFSLAAAFVFWPPLGSAHALTQHQVRLAYEKSARAGPNSRLASGRRQTSRRAGGLAGGQAGWLALWSASDNLDDCEPPPSRLSLECQTGPHVVVAVCGDDDGAAPEMEFRFRGTSLHQWRGPAGALALL